MNLKKLHKKLIVKKLTISVAESCTGGLLANNPPVQDSATDIVNFFLINFLCSN